MSGKKDSFVLYHDIRAPLTLLNDAERGKLFLAILDYSENGIIPDFSGGLGMAFAFLREAIDRDARKWETVREQRAEAGRKGGKQTQAKRANASVASISEQNVANQAVPVPAPAPVPVSAPVSKTTAFRCERCGKVISSGVADFSIARYGRYLCQPCQQMQTTAKASGNNNLALYGGKPDPAVVRAALHDLAAEEATGL